MECQDIINDYIRWIKDNTIVKSLEQNKICSISTPFLDRHNDHIEIYLIKSDQNFTLTDNAYTIADLKMSGFEFNTPKREHILRTALNGFGVKINEKNELFIDASISNIGQKKHYLIQAILTVNDMFNLSQESIYSLFKEDVEIYFKQNDIFYSKDIKLSGKSGFDHNIDFLIPSFKQKPEKLIKTINTIKKEGIMTAIMAFNDIHQMRETETLNIVIYNDLEKKVSNDTLGALDSYNIKHIPWSKRQEFIYDFSLN